MSLVVVCFLAVSGDQSHDVVLFPSDPLRNLGLLGNVVRRLLFFPADLRQCSDRRSSIN